MQIIIRLIGYSEIIEDVKYVYELHYNINIFNFDILKHIFTKYAHIISNDELSLCTLTSNSINLKKETLTDSTVNDLTKHRIIIFTNNSEIKNKLITIFKLSGTQVMINTPNMYDDTVTENNGLVNNDISIYEIENEIDNNTLDNDTSDDDSEHSIGSLEEYINNFEASVGNIDDNEDTGNDSNEDTGNNSNEDTNNNNENDNKNNMESIDNEEVSEPIIINPNLELLDDPDFVQLLKIYYNKPYLLTSLYKYTNTCAMQLINDASYDTNYEIIKNLNLNFNDTKIMEALKLNNNHINLSIGYLLNNK